MYVKMRIVAVVILTFSLAYLPKTARADSTDMIVDGRAFFQADQSLIAIKLGINGLVFDTSDCPNCESQLPVWRFIGDLKVDSIVQSDWSKVALTDESQMDSVSINSVGLQDALKDINVYELIKMFPNRVPADTLFWDSIRVKRHIIPDLSVYYEIRYSDTTEYDAVLQKLLPVTNIGGIGPVQMPVEDG